MACAFQNIREDDYVEYFLFTKSCKSDSLLQTLSESINSLFEKFENNYLWHKDNCKVIPRLDAKCQLLNELSNSSGELLLPHLYGVSHYGDNIEDEWFIVYLLFEISKQFDDLLIRVCDADGEFLLIEAANYLPAWANPETCEKRVYIYNGAIHIIPINEISCDDETKKVNDITVAEALQAIWENPHKTRASQQIQDAISKRIFGYPQKINDNLHRVRAYVPASIAALLKKKPALISAAVHAFCNRDPLDRRACQIMRYFPPEHRVFTTLTLTKFMYAMLASSKYIPDRKIGWNIPAFNSPHFKAYNIGVKIACGFEILVSQAKPSQNSLENDRGWALYLKQLKEKNYFDDLLEGSKPYTELLDKAKYYYIKFRDTMNYAPVIGQDILDMLANLDCDSESFHQEISSLPEDDDESWMEVNPDELNKMLEEKYGCKSAKMNGECNSSDNAANVAGKLTQFLNHISGLEGVEFPNPPTKPPRKRDKNKQQDGTSTPDLKINFDPSTFSCAVQNILDLVIPNDNWDLESGSEMSDYESEQDIDYDKDLPEQDEKIRKYMEKMDLELAATTIGESFEKKTASDESDGFDDVETFKPVDIDMNALKSMFESYQSQLGTAGPATNMLGPMGVHLENEIDKNKD